MRSIFTKKQTHILTLRRWSIAWLPSQTITANMRVSKYFFFIFYFVIKYLCCYIFLCKVDVKSPLNDVASYVNFCFGK